MKASLRPVRKGDLHPGVFRANAGVSQRSVTQTLNRLFGFHFGADSFAGFVVVFVAACL
jgi:hypothetical protein